ncbi:hypothetical protein MsAc7_03180 [Methanolapillus millepedarum]|uniref:Uncharacterized protein n=1 Tax=Methanolapillus millepedarum TaxID=3028296 RepID=A0AA96V2I1_9EURY|nr:hypothetical protein MsAc7_03180 [Methanosarcinaceae archaeon Ac7]
MEYVGPAYDTCGEKHDIIRCTCGRLLINGTSKNTVNADIRIVICNKCQIGMSYGFEEVSE